MTHHRIVAIGPYRVLETALAVCIPLWESGLEEDDRAAWNHRRTWSVSGTIPAANMALAAAHASLDVLRRFRRRKRLTKEEQTAAEYARDYLFSIRNCRFSLDRTVSDMMSQLAMDLSPCIQEHYAMGSGTSWFQVPETSYIRSYAYGLKGHPVRGRFLELIRARYGAYQSSESPVDADREKRKVLRLFDAHLDRMRRARKRAAA